MSGLRTYNNNKDNGVSNTTYSPISLSNPASELMASRFSISYFNKIMKIAIAEKNGMNGDNATYDNQNQAYVFIPYQKAKILAEMMQLMKEKDDIHNVCVELTQGLLKVSDGSEFGINNICFTITQANSSGKVKEYIYETKKDLYIGAYNYNNKTGKYSTHKFESMEYDTFMMVLEEYYKASAYATPAFIMEASMYKRNAQYELIRAIADKVGASTNNSSGYNSRTFLAGGNDNNNNGLNGIPKEYETSTFDEIANSLA